MLLDTTLLIDLQREARSGCPAGAMAFLADHRETRLYVSVITIGEYAEGFRAEDGGAWRLSTRGYGVLPVTEQIAGTYAAVSRTLRTQGVRIGDNDVWIAATALEHGLPLVTRDASHFGRIDGLHVLTY